MLEISSLKERRLYYVTEIRVRLHEGNQHCLIVEFERDKKKVEVYECDHAADLYHMYKEYKMLADERDDQLETALCRSQSVVVGLINK